MSCTLEEAEKNESQYRWKNSLQARGQMEREVGCGYSLEIESTKWQRFVFHHTHFLHEIQAETVFQVLEELGNSKWVDS